MASGSGSDERASGICGRAAPASGRGSRSSGAAPGERCLPGPAPPPKLLGYVVTQTLAGRGDQLKAYDLAISVLGRDASFDAAGRPDRPRRDRPPAARARPLLPDRRAGRAVSHRHPQGPLSGRVGGVGRARGRYTHPRRLITRARFRPCRPRSSRRRPPRRCGCGLTVGPGPPGRAWWFSRSAMSAAARLANGWRSVSRRT